MRKLMIPIIIIALLLAIYEQSKEHPNVFITAAAVLVFMFGIMRLSAKIPGRKSKEDDDNIQ
jgi:hypothetical protein